MKKLVLGMLVLSIAVFAGCSAKNTKELVSKEGEIAREWIEEGITKDAVIARGIGAADQKLENKTQKMATSRNSAIVNAQYNMLAMIKGIKLTGGITVEKAIEGDSKLQTEIDAMIKGAQVIKTEWTSDDGCVITLRLAKKKIKALGLDIPIEE